MKLDETMLFHVPNCYEVVPMVAISDHYVCAIVVSHSEINKRVSQWPLAFNLYISVTWPLTCAFQYLARTP